jgi:hypothetical protein
MSKLQDTLAYPLAGWMRSALRRMSDCPVQNFSNLSTLVRHPLRLI